MTTSPKGKGQIASRRIISAVIVMIVFLGVIGTVFPFSALIEKKEVLSFDNQLPMSKTVSNGTEEAGLSLPETLRVILAVQPAQSEESASNVEEDSPAKPDFVQLAPVGAADGSYAYSEYGYVAPSDEAVKRASNQTVIYTVDRSGEVEYRVYGIYNGEAEPQWYVSDVEGNITGVVKDVPVSWQSENYKNEQAGAYQFVAQLQNGYTYNGDMPTFAVTVEEKAEVPATSEPSNPAVSEPNGTIENPQNGNLQLSFSEVDADKPARTLSGGQFVLTDQANEAAVYTMTANADGVVQFVGLAAGTYTLTETVAPLGYAKPSGSWVVVVHEDGNFSVSASADAEGAMPPSFVSAGGAHHLPTRKASIDFTIQNVDAIYQDIPLAGTQFTLINSSTGIATSLTADANGMVTLSALQQGAYVLRQTSVLSGYKLPAGEWNITVDFANETVVSAQAMDAAPEWLASAQEGIGAMLPTEKISGTLVITKYSDAGLSTRLGEAVFEILDARGTVIRSDIKTDELGNASVPGLPEGEYTLRETNAPSGYATDKTDLTISIVAGKTTWYTFSAKPLLLTIPESRTATRATKQGKTGSMDLWVLSSENTEQKLAGVVFDLVDAEGKIAKTGLTTDAEGHVHVSSVPAGSYTLVNTATPEGYIRYNNSEIDIPAGAAFKFNLYLLEGENVEAPVASTMQIMGAEVQSAEPYADEWRNSWVGFSAAVRTSETTSTVVTYVQVKIFEVANPGVVVAEGFTDLTGTYRYDFSDVGEAKEYYFETTLPTGYTFSPEMTPERRRFTTESDNTVFAAEFLYPEVKVEYKDTDGNLLDSKTFTGAFGTPYDADKTFPGYTFKEILNGTAGKFPVAPRTVTYVYTKDDQPSDTTTVSVRKVDGDNFTPGLEGVSFSLYRLDGMPPTEVLIASGVKSDADGYARVSGVGVGTYVWKEEAPPFGYNQVPPSSSFDVVMTASGAYADLVEMNNVKIPAKITIRKVDEKTGDPLAGAVFKFVRTPDSGTTAREATVTTGADGKATTANLLPGKYTVTEITAPPGYDLMPGPMTVTVNMGGQSFNNTIVEIKNKRSGTPFKFTKVDASDTTTPLAGAVFELYKPTDTLPTPVYEEVVTDGSVYWVPVLDDLSQPVKVTTTANGIVDLGTLPDGDYMLVEVVAPSGYDLPEGQWLVHADQGAAQKITITGKGARMPLAFITDGTIDNFKLPNMHPFDIPNAGMGGVYPFLALGGISIGVALLLFILNKRKNIKLS